MDYSMTQVDKVLGLRRGAANFYRSLGLFHTFSRGSAWYVDESELPDVAAAIEAYQTPPPAQDGEVMLSVEKAAERLGLKRSTIYNQIKKGRISATRAPNGRVYVSLGSIEHYRTHRLPVGLGLKLRSNMGRSSRVSGYDAT